MNRTPRRALLLAVWVALLVAGPTAARADGARSAPAPTAAAGAGAGAGAETAAGAGATISPSAAMSYGIADAMGAFARCRPGTPECCDAEAAGCAIGEVDGYFDDPDFERLLTPASAHRVSEVRLFVSYDALQEWNGSTTTPGCVYSRVVRQPWYDAAGRPHDPAESWRDLLAGLIEARADDLLPVVAITGYGSPHATPSWDSPAPDPTTVGGWWEYHCGVQGILDAVAKLPGWEQPHVWEAFNEPDGFSLFRSLDGRQASSCTPGATAQPDGPAKAACLYVAGASEIHQFAGHTADTVIAGTFMHPNPSYLATYAAALGHDVPDGAYPANWSVHDYVDVTGAAAGETTPQITAFDQALATDTGGRARALWVTEAGTLLTSARPGGSCPAVGPDPAGTLGACVDGNPTRQATSAAAFFALPQSAGAAVPVTHLFWYQWQSAVNWDSGLVDAQNVPRAGWCAFYGSGTCHGDPDAS